VEISASFRAVLSIEISMHGDEDKRPWSKTILEISPFAAPSLLQEKRDSD
jgi:hypothetical protein